jgi:agmatinase
MYTLPNTFARRELTLAEAELAYLGIPYDSSESNRTGSRFAPNAIRQASRELEDYDMELGFNLLDLLICDLGDVEVSYGNFDETFKRAKKTIEEVLDNEAIPISIGGEHTISFMAAKALRKKPYYVVYDGHLDYREEYLENRFSHASTIRRLSEEAGPENLAVIGVRSASTLELKEAKEDNIFFIGSKEFYNDKKGTHKKLLEATKDRDVYLSIDMDVFDPSEAKGVCNPEPGGLYYRDIVESLYFLKHCRLLGMDLTELAPNYDYYSPILAANLIFKILALSKS